MECEETCGRFIMREGLAVSCTGRHRKLPSRLIASSLPHDAPLFRHQYCGENIKMMEEGVDVEAFYVCVKFTLISESRSTVLRGPPRLTYKRKIYTYK